MSLLKNKSEIPLQQQKKPSQGINFFDLASHPQWSGDYLERHWPIKHLYKHEVSTHNDI